MDNLHSQKTEEKSIQTEDQPKITNFQVESQKQYTVDYKDESKHEGISMHTIEKHSTHHHYNPLKNDPSVFEYMYPPEHGEYPWITNPDFTNQHSISQFISKLHIQHFNNTKIIHQISSSQELSTSQNNKAIHKLYKKQEKLRQDCHSTYKKLPTENCDQITKYGEHMKQWGDTINNIFPNKKIHLEQWNPTFHV